MLNPSRYRIFAIGKLRSNWIGEGIARYLKRLPGLTITELRDSPQQKTAKAISSLLRKDEALVVLTETGESFNSKSLAKYLQKLGSKRLVFVIGAANGLGPEIEAIANLKLSLSPMTFPHELARLLLVEQIYRAKTIIDETPYHREQNKAQ